MVDGAIKHNNYMNLNESTYMTIMSKFRWLNRQTIVFSQKHFLLETEKVFTFEHDYYGTSTQSNFHSFRNMHALGSILLKCSVGRILTQDNQYRSLLHKIQTKSRTKSAHRSKSSRICVKQHPKMFYSSLSSILKRLNVNRFSVDR